MGIVVSPIWRTSCSSDAAGLGEGGKVVDQPHGVTRYRDGCRCSVCRHAEGARFHTPSNRPKRPPKPLPQYTSIWYQASVHEDFVRNL
jgi:hypothetical protein